VIQPLITSLVQTAPALDRGTATQLIAELRELDTPLAISIAAIVELLLEQRVDPGIALPALAMACATLDDVLRGALGPREAEAARYEIETLLPVPGAAPTHRAAPNLIQISRERPPRT
jgi:hypothetical protein